MLIIDALDECANRKDLIKQLQMWRTLNSNTSIHILITNRKGLCDFETTLNPDLQLEITSHDDDVRSFLQQSLNENCRLSD